MMYSFNGRPIHMSARVGTKRTHTVKDLEFLIKIKDVNKILI